MTKDLNYYLNLNWTLIEGEDLDFEGKLYHYIMIEEIPSFCFCAKTVEKARENYKKQLKLTLTVMLESGEQIKEPGEDNQEPDWETLCQIHLPKPPHFLLSVKHLTQDVVFRTCYWDSFPVQSERQVLWQ